MKRRNFIQTSLVASAVPVGCVATKTVDQNETVKEEKELYELRTYDIKWGSSSKVLLDHIQNVLKPALLKMGVNNVMLFNENGSTSPKKIWVLISYPSSAIYVKAQGIQTDPEFMADSTTYSNMPSDKPIYNRFTSSLIHAFDGFPKMANPIEGAGIYELRIYEGYNEDAVRRKIKMFNVEEIPLFAEVGLYPIFFGDMIAGPYRPCLVYMINVTDMEAHGQAWKRFVAHPEWIRMKDKPEYANSISNIRNYFLTPIS